MVERKFGYKKMQTAQIISESQIEDVLVSIFSSGNPIVKEACSDFDQPTKTFSTIQELRDDIDYTPGQERKFFYYSIYYPEAKGVVLDRRIDLKPGAVKNHTHRFRQEGWGLIYLQITYEYSGAVECRIVANSEKRANNWDGTPEHYGDPNVWDWDVVKHHAGRLIRIVRKLAKQQAKAGADNQRPIVA